MDFLRMYPLWRGFLLFVSILPVFYSAYLQCEERYPRNEQLQAAFFHKFLGFIQWESSPHRVDGNPVLCVIGESSLPVLLQELISRDEGEVRVTSIQNVSDAEECSLLFISSSYAHRLESLLNALSGSGVVTVSDIPNFAESGGVIQFVQDESRVRFLINREAAERQGVKLSSQLLALAQKEVS